MSHIHIVIGPVGAGKSTFTGKLASQHRAVKFNLDAWMARLYGDDERPATGVLEWYVERMDRCLGQIWSVAQSILDLGNEVVLEIGLIRRQDRDLFYQKIDGAGYTHTLYVVDAPREIRRQRVMQRNQEQGETFSVIVPPDIFEFFSDLWEPPTNEEPISQNVILIDTSKPNSTLHSSTSSGK